TWVARRRSQPSLIGAACPLGLRKLIVDLQENALCKKLSVVAFFIFAQDCKRIDQPFRLSSVQTIKMKDSRVDFCPQQNPPGRLPAKWRMFTTEIGGKGRELLAGVTEFQNPI